MKKLIFIILSMIIFSCDGFITQSTLQGKWIYQTSSIYESIEFKKNSFEWVKLSDSVEVERVTGTFKVKQVSESGKWFNTIYLYIEGVQMQLSFKIAVENGTIFKVEGSSVTSYYIDKTAEEVEESAAEASK